MTPLFMDPLDITSAAIALSTMPTSMANAPMPPSRRRSPLKITSIAFVQTSDEASEDVFEGEGHGFVAFSAFSEIFFLN